MLLVLDIMFVFQRGYFISSEKSFKNSVPCNEDGNGSEKPKHRWTDNIKTDLTD